MDLESDVLTHHVTALLASPGRAAMDWLASDAPEHSLSVVQQTLLHRGECGLYVSALGFLDLIKEIWGVRYKLNYFLAQLQLPYPRSLSFLFPTTHLLHYVGLLGEGVN